MIVLTSDMTMDELEAIVKNCKKNKSPGLDGLGYEFYQVTFDIIKEDLLLVFKSQLLKKEIIESDRSGVALLCPKVKGVPSVEELRPITLLNCDFKILSKWLVSRLWPVLPKIIKSSQLCTVEKRNILFGITNVLSTIIEVNEKKSHACLISLDFYKAYDRVY